MDYHLKVMTRNSMRKTTPNLVYTIYMYILHIYVYIYIYIHTHTHTYIYIYTLRGFRSGTSSKEPACRCRRHKRYSFDPWAGQIPWKREWQPTPVFLPRESPWTEEPGGLQTMKLQRVRHDWSDLARIRVYTCMYLYKCVYSETCLKWKRKGLNIDGWKTCQANVNNICVFLLT